MARMPKVATARARRRHYRENMLLGFDALAELYYVYWGEFFHLAVFEPGDDSADLTAAYQRTHERYLEAIGGSAARRILDVACGGGALSAWLADHTTAQVVGVDLSGGQLAHARRWIAGGRRPNLRFVQHDVMHLGDLAEPPFDAAVCLDAACYLPDRRAALRGIAARLRPGGRLLLVDWCRAERPAALQRELILEPLCCYWAIADLATVADYRRSFAAAGLRIRQLDDLSDLVVPNWERGYRAALRALAEPVRVGELLRLAAGTVKHGAVVIQAAKDQFQVALLAKAAAECGLLRYVSVLAERTGNHRGSGGR
ncbi:MAG TPA: methyltransferase domain-containing protein [Actinomycetes bacterium]|jgi:SAM-dependent methyltransferase|nr:methyltransferase domain-containing protein [Actinomycetes bacterium]